MWGGIPPLYPYLFIDSGEGGPWPSLTPALHVQKGCSLLMELDKHFLFSMAGKD